MPKKKKKIIFGETINYEYANLDAIGLHGQYNPVTKTITLGAHLKGKELIATLIHEELHAVLRRQSISQVLSNDLEEILIENICTYLIEHYNIKEK